MSLGSGHDDLLPASTLPPFPQSLINCRRVMFTFLIFILTTISGYDL